MKGQKKANIGSIRGENGLLFTEDKDKADNLNQSFAKIGNKLASNNKLDTPFEEKQHIHRITPTISSICFKKTLVSKCIEKRLKPGKGCGPDNVLSKDLKIVGAVAADGLTKLMTIITEKSEYPSQWKKQSKICIKEGSKLERGNHRHLSVLSIPSKIFEWVIGHELNIHFVKGGISSGHQWGFKEGKSTETLMLHLTEKWKQALEEKKVVGVLFIDFKKAFDSICHKTLALKLQAAGITGPLYDLITNCLTNWKQYVEMNGQCSTQKSV